MAARSGMMQCSHRLQMKDEEVVSELKRLRDKLGMSYGPLGRLSLLCPFAGAALTVTNRSEKILQLVKSRNPVIKMILSSLQLHCQHYREAGLYATLLANSLIVRGLELPYPQYKVAMVTGYVMSLVCDWLGSGACPAKRRLSLESVGELMCLIKTFLSSKLTVYGVNNSQLDHISSLLLQGFLRVTPSQSFQTFSFGERIHVLSCYGLPVQKSLLLGGVVIPVSKEDAVPRMVRRDSDGVIRVVLFDMSLAGDVEDFPVGVSLEAESDSGLHNSAFEDMVITRLMGVASRVVELGAGLVGCQKCVHPLLKDYLREKGVCVVERLSSLHIGPVKSISGAQPISNLCDESSLSERWLGRLKEVRPVAMAGETYLQLEGVGEEHCSLMVVAHLRGMSEEMAALCSDAVAILEQTVQLPFVLSGGGCMETLVAHYLMQESRKPDPYSAALDVLHHQRALVMQYIQRCGIGVWFTRLQHQLVLSTSVQASQAATDDCLTQLQCDQRTVSDVMKSVAESFVTVATWVDHDRGTVAVDSVFHHCWLLPPLSVATPTLRKNQTCCCGSIKSSSLPPGCVVTRAGRGEPLFVMEGDSRKQREDTKQDSPNSLSVCDCYTAKLRATELSADIASTVLQTAWVQYGPN